MHKSFWTKTTNSVLLTLLLCGLIPCGDGRRRIRSVESQSVAESSNLFAEDVYKALTQPGQSFEDRNVLISPISLDIGFAMLMAGATGETKEEIKNALRLERKDLQDSKIHAGFKDLISSYKESSNYEDEAKVQIADRVFVGQVYPIKPSYLHTTRENYLADAEQINFGEMNAAANKVNSWVKEATKRKIQEIVVPSMLNNQTAMILVNAIHFKGEWMYPFDPEATHKRKFRTLHGGETQVEMMYLDKPKLKYVQLPELRSSAVALPYYSERFSLVILLPDQHERLPNVEAKLKDGVLASIPQRMRNVKVELKLPKFKLESNVDLVASKVLETLGMASITTQFAEFGGISDEPGLRVTNVVHKTFLDVNEAGTEAAAATAFVAQARCLDVDQRAAVKFTVDRPFLAYIFDSRTKTVLFIARKIM